MGSMVSFFLDRFHSANLLSVQTVFLFIGSDKSKLHAQSLLERIHWGTSVCILERVRDPMSSTLLRDLDGDGMPDGIPTESMQCQCSSMRTAGFREASVQSQITAQVASSFRRRGVHGLAGAESGRLLGCALAPRGGDGGASCGDVGARACRGWGPSRDRPGSERSRGRCWPHPVRNWPSSAPAHPVCAQAQFRQAWRDAAEKHTNSRDLEAKVSSGGYSCNAPALRTPATSEDRLLNALPGAIFETCLTTFAVLVQRPVRRPVVHFFVFLFATCAGRCGSSFRIFVVTVWGRY